MTPTQAPAALATATPTKRQPAAWPPLALAVGSAAAYAIFFALPYVVNGLAQYPLAEVAYGMPDPMTQWPHADGGLVSFAFGMGALLTLACAPFGAGAGVVWGAVNLWRERTERNGWRIIAASLAVVFGIGAYAWLGSPLGSALITRFLD